nr:hypothetical protein [Tanacetum cinerariifolium]
MDSSTTQEENISNVGIANIENVHAQQTDIGPDTDSCGGGSSHNGQQQFAPTIDFDTSNALVDDFTGTKEESISTAGLGTIENVDAENTDIGGKTSSTENEFGRDKNRLYLFNVRPLDVRYFSEKEAAASYNDDSSQSCHQQSAPSVDIVTSDLLSSDGNRTQEEKISTISHTSVGIVTNENVHAENTDIGQGTSCPLKLSDVSVHGDVRAHEVASFQCADNNTEQVPVSKDIKIVSVTNHLSETPVGGKEHVVESRVPTLE